MCVCMYVCSSSSSSGSGSGMIADQYEAQEDTVWAPVMGEARAVKQSRAWRLRLPVCIVLGMAAAVFLVEIPELPKSEFWLRNYESVHSDRKSSKSDQIG